MASSSLFALACALVAAAATTVDFDITATFYLPLPLLDLANTFDQIDNWYFPNGIRGPRSAKNPYVGDLTTVTFETSIVVAVQGTIVVYDHQEDGFDTWPNYNTVPTGTTQIWGDGNPDNGSPPGYCNTGDPPSCDSLQPGSFIEIESIVNVATECNQNNLTDCIVYDGGDRVQSTHALAITYYAYPIWQGTPRWFGQNIAPGDRGTMFAGAVEVFASNFWDTLYVAPAGSGDSSSTFEYASLYIQAGDRATTYTVTDKDGVLLSGPNYLGQGESGVFDNVTRGDTVNADRSVQVHLVTGDQGSSWELRWFALLPVFRWGTEYMAPVASEMVSFWIYHNEDIALVVSCDTSEGPCPKTFEIGPKEVREIRMGAPGITPQYDIPVPVAPDTDPGYTGVHFYADAKFLVLMQMDNGNAPLLRPDEADSYLQRYDWGSPVVPNDELSTLVVVPMGRGCKCEGCPRFKAGATEIECSDTQNIVAYGMPYQNPTTGVNSTSIPRSVVWLTPESAGFIEIDIDRNGDGLLDCVTQYGCADFYLATVPEIGGGGTRQVGHCNVSVPYDSIRFAQCEDPYDLSGAVIQAFYYTDAGVQYPMRIAAMWGQDPAFSGTNDDQALDLGTFVTPITNPWVGKNIISVTHPDGTVDENQTVTGVNDTITYEISITNVGIAPVTNIVVTDPMLDDLHWCRTSNPPGGPLAGKDFLRTNETWWYCGTYRVKPEDLKPGECIRNDAFASSAQGDAANLTANECARIVIATPTATPSSAPTPLPTPSPSFTPKPTAVPSPSPSVSPTPAPSQRPSTTTTKGTRTLSDEPSVAPTACIVCTSDEQCEALVGFGSTCRRSTRRRLLFGYYKEGCCTFV